MSGSLRWKSVVLRGSRCGKAKRAPSETFQPRARACGGLPAGFTCRLFSSSSSSSSSTSTKPFSVFGFFDWYLGVLKSHPVLTKSTTASLIYVAADLSSQTITRPMWEGYDTMRTLRMAGYGLLILGPSLHVWISLLSRHFPQRDVSATFKKVLLGQVLYGPVMTVVFFSLNAGLQGETVAEIIARLKRDLLPTMLNGVAYWPLCDFVTFKFIPTNLQPLVCNSFSYLWTIYITYMANLGKADSSSSNHGLLPPDPDS